MKKIMLLSFALLSAVLVLNSAKALNDTGVVTLDVTAGTGSCEYGTDLTITSIASSYNTGLTDGAYQDPFRCEDLQGTQASWSLTLEQTTDLVNNSNTNYTIPKANVSTKSDLSSDVSGLCNTYAGTTSFTSIGDGTPETILGKDNDQGAICKVEAKNVMLQVETVANQPVGTYTGTIQVVYPSFL